MAAEEDEPDFIAHQPAEITGNYRLKPIRLNINSMADVPSLRFVEDQISLLQEDLLVSEDLVEIQENGQGVNCNLCLTNVATRIYVPCGHWAGCYMCTAQLVNTPRYFVSIDQHGDVNDEEECRLPVRCPQCQCLVGNCMRVF